MFVTSLYKFVINKTSHLIVSEFAFTIASQMYFETIRGRNNKSVRAYVHDKHYHDKFGQMMENYHKKDNKIITEKLKFWYLVS